MPIDTKTERRIAAREIGRNLGVAVEHLKVGARLVGAGTLVVVGVGGLLAGFFGCYFGFVVSLQGELQSVNAEANERAAAKEKAHRVLTADIAKLKTEHDSALDLTAKAEELRVRYATQLREEERVEADKNKPVPSGTMYIGETLQVWAGDDHATVMGGRTAALRDRATRLAIAKDFGFREMVIRGDAGLLEPFTKVKLISVEDFSDLQVAEVRVLSGSEAEKMLWIDLKQLRRFQ